MYVKSFLKSIRFSIYLILSSLMTKLKFPLPVSCIRCYWFVSTSFNFCSCFTATSLNGSHKILSIEVGSQAKKVEKHYFTVVHLWVFHNDSATLSWSLQIFHHHAFHIFSIFPSVGNNHFTRRISVFWNNLRKPHVYYKIREELYNYVYFCYHNKIWSHSLPSRILRRRCCIKISTIRFPNPFSPSCSWPTVMFMMVKKAI